ncbi:non-homologous end-joining DNA ligase [Thermasporomyces composti]|uniref:Bifunctional non-homologous end joining protein LigD n=1 Tax=Thermasporomyces composti TaxID=696763 RepID=A0A3D9V5T4_THECX|nr:non-homologous end-joining DNA ligase [Thermasporomyces composti]REF35530.1 bifunctional non-homologous end joining protein LigD [Thermasporomyces composti]
MGVDSGGTVRVRVDRHVLQLSNLDKVLYPRTGFTKGEVIDYYSRVADVLLPHLESRPLTRKRWPDGVEGEAFFEKNKPRGTPSWVRTVTIDSPGSTRGSEVVEYVVVDRLATLVWLANLAALELHVPQWRVGPRGRVHHPDLVVVDLDPGPPADLVACCRVALLLRDLLDADGLRAWPKTSGSKGMQLYVPVEETPGETTSAYTRELAERLARDHPDLVVASMTKSLRKGKVFLDWSQNNPAKTTVAPYSLRGLERPTVSTPVTWEEVEACRTVGDLTFEATDVLDRIQAMGDLFAPLTTTRQRLP